MAQRTICAGCNFTSSTVLTGESQDWIRCDGCNGWFHFACAGFQTARDVRGVDKYFCRPCKPTHGPTTYVRKSNRAHSTVDYAGLNEGVLRTSDENPEHHYIRNFKDGTYQFDKETFARMPPELVNLEYFEKMNGFREPIVIPASLNPRPKVPCSDVKMTDVISENTGPSVEPDYEHYDYGSVHDDGQDKLDMVIPQGLTVRRVAEMYGLGEPVEVIDVKSQQGEPDKKWDMKRWADYYEETGEKIVRNVISLEVSKSKLGRLIRRPKVVRDMDLQDSVWPAEDKANAPKVQFYCLMSVADCYTDFHIDFGGSSVYYHIVKGKKTFFFIPPTKQNLKKYEDWCLSPAQDHTFLAHQVKECYRVDLSEGDTMLIPAGWIHAVWTPENSLVIGGNFLTRLNYGMQIRVFEVEKATKVARKFRYPNFQKVLWLTMLKYLDDDPLPQFVANALSDGKKFERQIAIYCEPDRFGHNSHLGTQYYNSRYYSKAELDGLPDLANYIWRTVMISLGQIEGITQETRNAVKRSIPKGRGDPLELVKKFAMWTAWKRGNEEIPQWAHPQALLPENGPSKGETKLSAAALKKLERKSWSEAFRASRDRPSRQMPAVADTIITNGAASSHLLAPTPHVSQRSILENGRHLSTPKTSQLGPKRIACDACRKRRIRCKHKDALTESQRIMANSSPILVTTPLTGSSSLAGVAIPLGQPIKLLASDMEPVASVLSKPPKPNGLVAAEAAASSSDFSLDIPNNKSGRVKACLDCRKSKRRCIHDEYGRVDPVKASEAPVPRGSATKKRKHGDDDASPASKKVKR
ncbi:Clavaminate synthase-like protein, partial [Mytilinidion resinicola]